MSKTVVQKLTATKREIRLFHQERAILELTELVCELLKTNDMSRSRLAKKLGKTKGYVSQLLDGNANMTIRTISDVFFALGRALHFSSGNLALEEPAVDTHIFSVVRHGHLASHAADTLYATAARA